MSLANASAHPASDADVGVGAALAVDAQLDGERFIVPGPGRNARRSSSGTGVVLLEVLGYLALLICVGALLRVLTLAFDE